MKYALPIALLALACARPSVAQTPVPPASPANEPFAVIDNSFLVEEAFNQDPGVVQNIFSWTRDHAGAWNATFTQEWPLAGVTHQVSYTLPFAGGAGAASHLGAVLLNYRFQVSEESAAHPAIASRLSVILPTGSSEDGSDHAGLQTNVALSRQVRNLYIHANAGFTWIVHVPVQGEAERSLLSPQIAGSVVWRTGPMLQLMLESVELFQQSIDSRRERLTTISPGVRRGWNIGKRQIVVGAAAPVTTGGGDSTAALLLYGSYETPFK